MTANMNMNNEGSVWDLSALRESRVASEIQESQRHLKESREDYLTLHVLAADGTERQVSRCQGEPEKVPSWLVQNIHAIHSTEPMLKLRLRRWKSGGRSSGSTVIILSRKAPARPVTRHPEAPAPAPVSQGEGLSRHQGTTERQELVSADALYRLERLATDARESSRYCEREIERLRNHSEELVAQVDYAEKAILKLHERLQVLEALYES